jgi:hypothetical protein
VDQDHVEQSSQTGSSERGVSEKTEGVWLLDELHRHVGVRVIPVPPEHKTEQWRTAVRRWKERQQADPNTPEGFYWSEEKRAGGE